MPMTFDQNSELETHICAIVDMEVGIQTFFLSPGVGLDYINGFFRSIHAENVKAGWWSDIATGKRKERNFGEMAALIWSEIGEALVSDGPDDKLPIYAGYIVEIADGIIRLADLLGSGMLGSIEDAATAFQAELIVLTCDVALIADCSDATCIGHWLNFFESGRRGKNQAALVSGAKLMAYLFKCGEDFYDSQSENGMAHEETINDHIWTVIAAKQAFNRQRADHKVENRLLDGGKKI